jgi:hypothetical protein
LPVPAVFEKDRKFEESIFAMAHTTPEIQRERGKERRIELWSGNEKKTEKPGTELSVFGHQWKAKRVAYLLPI